MIGEMSYQNVCVIKALLQVFELVSRLKVNFHKSSLIGIHISDLWLAEAAYFLNCKTGRVPFVYLGLSVGANTQQLSTRKPVVDKVRKRLFLGGVVVSRWVEELSWSSQSCHPYRSTLFFTRLNVSLDSFFGGWEGA